METKNNKKTKSNNKVFSDNNEKTVSVDSIGKSLDDVLKECNVDLGVWDVDHYTIEENSKGYNFKIYFKKKTFTQSCKNELKKELASFDKIPQLKYKHKQNGMLLEFAPFDLHWGKLAWAEEAGQDYDMKEAASALNKAIDYTIDVASKFPVSKILFPFGNDFFQIDNDENTTTAGTRQDVDSRFKKILREGRKIVIETIEKLKQVAPVDVVIVAGNHGNLSEFMLGDLLEVKYEKDPNVNVNNSPMTRKYYTYGKNLIGFTHGNEERVQDLVGIMATEESELWYQCKHRFWHLGHFHMMQEREMQGVKIQYLASLSASDAWHKKKGYINNTRGVNSFLYDKEMGLVHRIFFNL